jgi:hypothetical protein
VHSLSFLPVDSHTGNFRKFPFLLTPTVISFLTHHCRTVFNSLSPGGFGCDVSPQANHKRAIFLITDALRFDFVTPNPPSPASPFHHNILSFPQDLTKKRLRHSCIFNSYADPPTTTTYQWYHDGIFTLEFIDIRRCWRQLWRILYPRRLHSEAITISRKKVI